MEFFDDSILQPPKREAPLSVRLDAAAHVEAGNKQTMSYYHTCPNCGANLDPCEKCDCGEKNYSIL